MFVNAYTFFQKGGMSSSLYFGTYKYDQLQEQSFRDMISCLSSMVKISIKVKQVTLRSSSKFARTFGIAKDMNSFAFP